MIIDTSALVAVGWREEGHAAIFEAMLSGEGVIPTPVLVEFRRVTSLAENAPGPHVDAMLAQLYRIGTLVLPFSLEHAEAATAANPLHGSGNGKGGPLNLLDLMVYGVAAVTGLPILCTGKNFAATDALLHPASRRY